MPFGCSGAPAASGPPRPSYVPVLDACQLPLQQLNPLALGEHHRAQGLHLRQHLAQHLVLGQERGKRDEGQREGKKEGYRREWNRYEVGYLMNGL